MPANVVVPEVGESIVDARVAKWLKKEGDAVNVGEALVELETDKIDLEVAASQGGVLGKITQGDGADVKVGDVIGVIDDASTSAASSPAASASAEATADKPVDKGAAKPVESPAPEAVKASEPTKPKTEEKTRVTPAAR